MTTRMGMDSYEINTESKKVCVQRDLSIAHVAESGSDYPSLLIFSP